MLWKKKPENAKQARNSRPDYDGCYKTAFGLAIVQIVGADDATVKEVWNALHDNAGDPRKQAKALLACLGTKSWHWPAYKGKVETEKDYKRMAEAMALHIDMLAHQLYRKEQLQETTEDLPFWEFVAGDQEDTPKACKAVDRTIKHFTDPFWQKHLPPCSHSNCRCQVFAHSEEDLKHNDKKA